MRNVRKAAWVLALAVAPGALPGCVISVGSSHARSAEERMEKLETRVRDAEQRLGIPSPEKE